MPYCVDCGMYIESGNTCSMCYGDPYHGTDGYCLEWLYEQDRQREEQERDNNTPQESPHD